MVPARTSRTRRMTRAVGFFAVGVVCAALGVGCFFAAPTWKGPASPHFTGRAFFNPGVQLPPRGFTPEGIGPVLKWQMSRKPTPWPAFHDEPTGPRPPADVASGQVRVTFINHATTLVQLDGINILTDPIYSDRCSPVAFAGPARVRPPGIAFAELPRIDAIVISHNHYDHLDVPTLRRLQGAWPSVRLFAGLGNKAYLEQQGLQNVVELDWFERRALGPVSVVCVPNQHFSNRGLGDADGTLWAGWAFVGARGYAYFGGDTGYGPHFRQVREQLGPARVAILPVGAYKPEWFMSPVHMSPAEAVQAALDLSAQAAIPVHWGTFSLGDDGEREAIDELAVALAAKPAPFTVLEFGQALEVP
jgi:L-ascorbate metabolism protein UlaG (beta-lactamase superfamily)